MALKISLGYLTALKRYQRGRLLNSIVIRNIVNMLFFIKQAQNSIKKRWTISADILSKIGPFLAKKPMCLLLFETWYNFSLKNTRRFYYYNTIKLLHIQKILWKTCKSDVLISINTKRGYQNDNIFCLDSVGDFWIALLTKRNKQLGFYWNKYHQ